jgi:hypothetical protein
MQWSLSMKHKTQVGESHVAVHLRRKDDGIPVDCALLSSVFLYTRTWR